ncbi:hypothetical protein CHU98_g11422 [Xylaria longipes]|nr:hypothetical protein CHU98_g11422 [Xylaria longipes]
MALSFREILTEEHICRLAPPIQGAESRTILEELGTVNGWQRGLDLPPEIKAQQRAAYQSADGVRFTLENVLTSRPGTLNEEVMNQCIQDSMRGNEAATAAWPDYASAEDYGELEEKIKVPVLVLRGDRDFERHIVRQLGTKLGWIHKTIEDCGHLIPLEKPKCLAKEILKFVERAS